MGYATGMTHVQPNIADDTTGYIAGRNRLLVRLRCGSIPIAYAVAVGIPCLLAILKLTVRRAWRDNAAT